MTSGNLNIHPVKTKVLLADDHPMVLQGLVASLSTSPDLIILGQARNGEEALLMARELRPDVLLLDIKMPKMNGFEVTKSLSAELPEIKIIILSVHNEKEYVHKLVRMGAKGYLLKSASRDEVLQAIDAVQARQMYLSPEVASAIIKQESDLSEREIEVLIMVTEGQSTKDIALQLGVSERTITTHRDNIMEKLNLHSIAALTKYAIANGFISM